MSETSASKFSFRASLFFFNSFKHCFYISCFFREFQSTS